MTWNDKAACHFFYQQDAFVRKRGIQVVVKEHHTTPHQNKRNPQQLHQRSNKHRIPVNPFFSQKICSPNQLVSFRHDGKQHLKKKIKL